MPWNSVKTRWPRTAVASALLLLTSAAAHAATTPAACQAGKNKAAGKLAACRHNAEAKFVASGDAAKYAGALGKCAATYASKWQKLELGAAGGCPSNGDEIPVANAIGACVSNVATALAGGPLANCPADLALCQHDLTVCEGDLATCDAAVGGATGLQLKTGQTECYDPSGDAIPCNGTGQDGELQKGVTRSYVDNGDGTITDNRTGLMWEKQSWGDGSIHSTTFSYAWSDAFTKIATLNATAFAGYSDWRLPNIVELRSLVVPGTFGPTMHPIFDSGCTFGCTVTTCSCTASQYWTSTTYAMDPTKAWWVHVGGGGDVHGRDKTTQIDARAVRGG